MAEQAYTGPVQWVVNGNSIANVSYSEFYRGLIMQPEFPEAPEWDGIIPDGQICQSHPLFIARDSFVEEDKEDSSLIAKIELLELECEELIIQQVPQNCKNKADIGEGIVIHGKVPEPRVHFVCQSCYDIMNRNSVEVTRWRAFDADGNQLDFP